MMHSSIQLMLQQAAQHHQAGRFEQAAALYQQVLSHEPDQVDAIRGLGLLALGAGRFEQAAQLLGRAVALRPDFAEAHNDHGIALASLGRTSDAVASFRQAASMRPAYAEAHANLGIALRQCGRPDEAIAALSSAIAAQPAYAPAYLHLAAAHRESGRLSDAIAVLERAAPSAQLLVNLGVYLREAGRNEDAIAAFHRAVDLQPDLAEAHNNLGSALADADQLDAAAEALRRAVELRSDYAEAWSNLGAVYTSQGRLDDAIAACQRAIAADPRYAAAHLHLGNALVAACRFDEAMPAFDEALAIEPASAKARWNRSLLLLLNGDYAAGLREYEYRWQADPASAGPRDFAHKRWDGSALNGRRILLDAEQGFGDVIQACRYVPMVADRGGRIFIEARAELHRLLVAQQWPAVEQIILAREPVPEFEVHCPMMSLPLTFGTTLKTIPSAVPYLRAHPNAAAHWSARLRSDPMRLSAGLIWAGKTIPDPRRTIGLAALAPLAQVPGTRFISLQKGPGSEQASHPPSGMELLDWTAELNDFADTAALMDSLDVIITIDTGTAHLAGALGKRTWVLLPFSPDWRWLRTGSESPWYPTMRLFRQRNLGDWTEPVREVVTALRELAATRVTQ